MRIMKKQILTTLTILNVSAILLATSSMATTCFDGQVAAGGKSGKYNKENKGCSIYRDDYADSKLTFWMVSNGTCDGREMNTNAIGSFSTSSGTTDHLHFREKTGSQNTHLGLDVNLDPSKDIPTSYEYFEANGFFESKSIDFKCESLHKYTGKIQ